jgi:hypothetical protein
VIYLVERGDRETDLGSQQCNRGRRSHTSKAPSREPSSFLPSASKQPSRGQVNSAARDSDAGSVPPSGIELALQCKRTPEKPQHAPPRNSAIPRDIPVFSVAESGGSSSTDFSTTKTMFIDVHRCSSTPRNCGVFLCLNVHIYSSSFIDRHSFLGVTIGAGRTFRGQR